MMGLLPPSPTQKQKILKHLQKKGKITTFDSFKCYQITRLSQYIMILREEGYNIESQWVRFKHKNPYVKYVLKTKKPNA